MSTKRLRLAQWRKSLGFSQEALAERLRVDSKTVRRWESGEAAPQPWLRRKLAECLQVSGAQLDALLFGNDGEGSEWSQPVDSVQELRNRVRDLDVRYDRAQSSSLLAETGTCLGQIMFLSTRVRTGRVREELRAVEAEGATLMGQLVWDASQRKDHAAAHGYFDQAIDAAKEVRDPAAQGLALLRKSFVALYGEKDPEKGLRLTMRTAETTAPVSHVLTGLAVLHAAEAHAMVGRQSECERALSQAETQFNRIGATDAALDLFSPTQHGRLAGSCYLFLNKPEQAQPILETTARELRDRSKSQAIVLGNLSLAYIRQGKIAEAVAVLDQAIDVVKQTWGGGGLNIIFGACRELQPWRRMVAVQDVYDRVMALMVT